MIDEPGVGDWHGVEARGKSPDPHSGDRAYVTPADYDGAKAQDASLGNDLLSYGVQAEPATIRRPPRGQSSRARSKSSRSKLVDDCRGLATALVLADASASPD